MISLSKSLNDVSEEFLLRMCKEVVWMPEVTLDFRIYYRKYSVIGITTTIIIDF